MTAPWPDHLLTLAEFDALPEDNSRRYELQEGVLFGTPRPVSFHQEILVYLAMELYPQLPQEWKLLPEVDVVLRPEFPPKVRVPDLVVVPTAVADSRPTRYTADQVLLAIEIVAPGSRVADTVTKVAEYATARIPHYWVLDPAGPLSLTTYELAGDLGYREGSRVTGGFKTTEPFPLTIDLAALPAGPERSTDR